MSTYNCNAVHIDNPVIGPGAAVEDDVSWALLVQRFSEIDGAVLWNVNTAGRCTHTGKTVVQSTQLWEAERCVCVCVGGGGGECQSCSPRCTGKMGDVWGRGEE